MFLMFLQALFFVKEPPVYEEEDLLDLGDVSVDLVDIMSSSSVVDLLLEGGECEESATDCDYDSVSSPGGSTCSGPIYIRHTGFGPEPHRPLSQRSDGTPSPGRVSPPLPGQLPPHVMQRDLLSRHRPLRLPEARGADKVTSSGSEAKKKKKKGLLLCPDYAEAAGKKEIRGVQVAAGTTSRLLAASMVGPAGPGLLSASRPKHKKGKRKTPNRPNVFCSVMIGTSRIRSNCCKSD